MGDCSFGIQGLQKHRPRTSTVQPGFISGRTPIDDTNAQNTRQAMRSEREILTFPF